jgi:hypothetical protein
MIGQQAQRVTFVRVHEGTTHPEGIYLNAHQLAEVVGAEFPEAAQRILAWESIALATEDDVFPRIS